MKTSEMHLFVLWERARRVERRILEDLRGEMEIVYQKEMSFRGDGAAAYEAFYGARRPVDGALKVKKCGGGSFLLIIVRDNDPHYGQRWARDDKYYEANEKMYDLKTRYREWAGRRYRVHGTTDCAEFARDVWLLTGHSAAEWERGIPEGVALNIPAVAKWSLVMEDRGVELGLSNFRIALEGKYINDVFYSADVSGCSAFVKCSSKCLWSIGNEYELGRRMYAVAPEVIARPLACCRKSAFIATEHVEGPSLTELLAEGLTDRQADAFAGDVLLLARGLRKTGILHRDLFPDNLLLGADGHLKAIDWQLAIDRKDYREDPWVARNWKFRYVVFGVNRELGLGVWNDYHALGKILAQFPQTKTVKAVAAELAADEASMTFAAPPKGMDRVRLWLYGCSLRFQMLFRRKGFRKYAQLERRWRTIRCKWR